MTKQELIDALAEQTGETKAAAGRFLDALRDNAQAELIQGGTVDLPGIGKFAVAERKATTGTNPRTGERIQIAAKWVAKFRPSAELRRKLNPVTVVPRRKVG